MRGLGLELPLLRRDPHYFLPTTGERYLLFGSDQEAMQRAVHRVLLRGGLARQPGAAGRDRGSCARTSRRPGWRSRSRSRRPPSATCARRCARCSSTLCRGSVGDYLDALRLQERPGQGDVRGHRRVLRAGRGTWDTPGTGMNFLVHNMCRLPGADGTWMIVEGGMGTGHPGLAERPRERRARRSGPDAAVSPHPRRGRRGGGVHCARAARCGREVVVVNADPFRMRDAGGRGALPGDVQRAARRLPRATGRRSR